MNITDWRTRHLPQMIADCRVDKDVVYNMIQAIFNISTLCGMVQATEPGWYGQIVHRGTLAPKHYGDKPINATHLFHVNRILNQYDMSLSWEIHDTLGDVYVPYKLYIKITTEEFHRYGGWL